MDTKNTPHIKDPAVLHDLKPLSPLCLERAKLETWGAGQIIYRPDQALSGIYYVVKGEVHLTRLLEQGFRKTLHVVHEGHFFFEGLYFWPEPRVLTVHAHTPARTAFFSSDTVSALLDDNASFRLTLFQSLAAKAINAGFEVVEMAYSDAHSRMGHVLRQLAFRRGTSIGESVHITISQTELAERMGLHPVSVNRILRKMEHAGYITTGRQRIVIHPPLLNSSDEHDPASSK